MRTSNVSYEEQYRLIMECRSSGLTYYQWCLEHDIKPGPFITWYNDSAKAAARIYLLQCGAANQTDRMLYT